MISYILKIVMPPLTKTFLCAVLVGLVCSGYVSAQKRLSTDEAEKLVVEAPPVVNPSIVDSTRIKGLVEVEITVSEQGIVTSARAISGHPLLMAAAVNAVKKQKYRPYIVSGKPMQFITVVDVVFPAGGGALTKEHKQQHQRDQLLANKYFAEEKKCRELMKSPDLKNAARVCTAVVNIADQLGEDRALEKMSANRAFGHVLLRQKRYPEAVDYFNRALKVVGTRLTEQDVELGELWGDLAIAHHLMRDLDNAREFYKKAEKILQTAYATFGDGRSDEWIESTKEQYLKSLKTLLGFHLNAALDVGAASEAEEIKKLIESLPNN